MRGVSEDKRTQAFSQARPNGSEVLEASNSVKSSPEVEGLQDPRSDPLCRDQGFLVNRSFSLLGLEVTEVQ